MIETREFRNNKITIYTPNGETITYEGKIYIYFGDKEKDGCIHFITADGKHHRIYGEFPVVIDEF